MTKTANKKRSTRDSLSTLRSGPALMQWRQARGISRPLFAQMAHFSERKLATYEKAPTLPNRVRRPIGETVNLIRALRELAGEDADLREWLYQPNHAFDQRSPLSLIVEGDGHLIWQMVYQIRQGTFS